MKKQYCIFYIVRHGESEWNVKGLLQGHSDSALTKKGINQAKLVKEALKNIHFDAVFSSDTLRASKTAEIITIEKKLTIKTTKLLRERSFGRWEGKPHSIFSNELKDSLKKFISLSDNEKKVFKFPDMESDNELIIRFITFLRETAIVYGGKIVLVATHGSMINALLIHLGFGTYAEISPNAISNGAYIKIESNGVDFFIKGTKGIIKKMKSFQ